MSRRSRTLPYREAARLRAVIAALCTPVLLLYGASRADLPGLVFAAVGLLVGLVTWRLARRSRWWTA